MLHFIFQAWLYELSLLQEKQRSLFYLLCTVKHNALRKLFADFFISLQHDQFFKHWMLGSFKEAKEESSRWWGAEDGRFGLYFKSTPFYLRVPMKTGKKAFRISIHNAGAPNSRAEFVRVWNFTRSANLSLKNGTQNNYYHFSHSH